MWEMKRIISIFTWREEPMSISAETGSRTSTWGDSRPISSMMEIKCSSSPISMARPEWIISRPDA